jgi:hypothetical protein
MPSYPPEIDYSDKYTDKYYEYRHIILPKDLMKKLPKGTYYSSGGLSARTLLHDYHLLGLYHRHTHTYDSETFLSSIMIIINYVSV